MKNKDGILSQEESEAYIQESKEFFGESVPFPETAGTARLTAKGIPSNHSFLVDINKSRYRLDKITFQERVRASVCLVRIDLDAAPHCNPDGRVLPEGAHIHIYKEGYDATWAYPLDDPYIKSLNPQVDLTALLREKNPRERFKLFSKFCYFLNEANFKSNEESGMENLFDI